MDSFYNPESGEGVQLGVYVHHARGIHNICIYANQDVYAKLSLTCSPDEAVSTRVAAAGGRNPQFEELLTIGVASPQSAVLKCEIWMLSRAKNLLEDQLLGFALVPVSSVAAAAANGERLTQDFSLSSTDLFHSPAGTVRLSLSLDSHPSTAAAAAASSAASSSNNNNNNNNNNSSCSITSEVVILDPADYRRIELELPDVAVAEENRQMVAEYFDIMSRSPAAAAAAARPSAPFLRLGSSIDDYDMIADNNDRWNSPDDNPCSFACSTTTSLSDESKKIAVDSSSNGSTTEVSQRNPPDTPTSKPGPKESKIENDSKERKTGSRTTATAAAAAAADLGSVFESPMGNINLEAEQAVMQQQIVEMYMKSMQQFTESLAKMKLPMDLDNPRSDDRGVVIQSQNSTSNSSTSNNNNNNNDNKLELEKKKKDGSRVFYGSRAFF